MPDQYVPADLKPGSFLHLKCIPMYASLPIGSTRPWDIPPAYINGSVERNPGARFFIPNANEWYKAAFYDPVNEVYYDYATGSDEIPDLVTSGTAPGSMVLNAIAPINQAGGQSPFGTMAQNGNMIELDETRYYSTPPG